MVHELLIEPGRAEKKYWRDLWRYRELFYFLAWRDLLVRYKQTVIGVLWSILRPLLTMVVFTVVFGRIAKLNSARSFIAPSMSSECLIGGRVVKMRRQQREEHGGRGRVKSFFQDLAPEVLTPSGCSSKVRIAASLALWTTPHEDAKTRRFSVHLSRLGDEEEDVTKGPGKVIA